jgi:hypothetical protein
MADEGPRMKRRVSAEQELMTGPHTEHHAFPLRFISRYVRDWDRAADLVQA